MSASEILSAGLPAGGLHELGKAIEKPFRERLKSPDLLALHGLPCRYPSNEFARNAKKERQEPENQPQKRPPPSRTAPQGSPDRPLRRPKIKNPRAVQPTRVSRFGNQENATRACTLQWPKIGCAPPLRPRRELAGPGMSRPQEMPASRVGPSPLRNQGEVRVRKMRSSERKHSEARNKPGVQGCQGERGPMRRKSCTRETRLTTEPFGRAKA